MFVVLLVGLTYTERKGKREATSTQIREKLNEGAVAAEPRQPQRIPQKMAVQKFTIPK